MTKEPAVAKDRPEATGIDFKWRLLLGLVIFVVGVVGYWPTLTDLSNTWANQPDYSHGYVVAPLAVLLLWLRRDSFPGFKDTSPLLSLALVGVSFAARYCSGRFAYTFLDGWSLMPWAASIAAVMGGRRLVLWCLPAIGFLFFMSPLPFRVEMQLSHPLQRIATLISTYTLQLFGYGAFAEGNVILLGDERLEVAQACSGLRLFVSIVALAYFYTNVTRRSWWERAVVAALIAPVAIASNSARIVVTGIVYYHSSQESLRNFVHDSAGWCTILFAAGLFWAFLWYSRKLIREEEVLDNSSLVRIAKLGL